MKKKKRAKSIGNSTESEPHPARSKDGVHLVPEHDARGDVGVLPVGQHGDERSPDVPDVHAEVQGDGSAEHKKC